MLGSKSLVSPLVDYQGEAKEAEKGKRLEAKLRFLMRPCCRARAACEQMSLPVSPLAFDSPDSATNSRV